ncbi:TetR/AcrR family transcriptional regulator [Frateuria sp. Soil773]|uniref:TetR/AcrR family transcriptional regulator n=1 Tax=Frateuria sp. Soil773 TaxID=1736407 RepID=UPI001F377CD5|nr:TetR/AcrR family transcriptional regulator [Frateuria sp. Soil773]
MNATPPPSPRERALLAAAAREFATAGFERASLNAVIRACGMSKSSFYHRFDSKQALFDRVVDEAAAALARELAAPDPAELAGPDFWPRLEAFVAHAAAALAKPAWYADLGKLFYLPDVSAERSAAMRRLLAGVDRWVQAVLKAGRACGAVRDDLPASLQAELAFAVLQAMDRWSIRHMETMGAAARRRLAASQLDSLRRLLAPD